MGRHAPLLVSIWDDPEFRALTVPAQHAYLMLLSQRKTSMVGLLPYTPRRWVSNSAGVTVDDIDAAIAELSDARFVLVDETTDEVLIRTRVKHDPPRGPKSIVAMWRAWSNIESRRLRQAVVNELPVDVWESDKAPPPDDAKTLRDAPSDGAHDAPLDGGADEGCDGLARARPGHPSTLPPKNSCAADKPTTPKLTAVDASDKPTRDAMWDALVAELGDATTQTARSNRGRTVKELLAVGATADDVPTRCTAYRKRWPDADLTDAALRKHWDQLGQRKDNPDTVTTQGGVQTSRAGSW